MVDNIAAVSRLNVAARCAPDRFPLAARAATKVMVALVRLPHWRAWIGYDTSLCRNACPISGHLLRTTRHLPRDIPAVLKLQGAGAMRKLLTVGIGALSIGMAPVQALAAITIDQRNDQSHKSNLHLGRLKQVSVSHLLLA